MRRTRSRLGFTVIDLVVVTAVLAGAMAILPSATRRNQEVANRIKCSSNMRQLCLAMKMYANSEVRTMAYPRTVYKVASADKPNFYTHPDAKNPFADGGPDANDVTAALFLLLRTQEITTDVFTCPSTQTQRVEIAAGKTVQDYSNFTSAKVLSYSFQNAYPTKSAIQEGFAFNDAMNADFAVLADMNPGGDALLKIALTDKPAEQRKVNSPNHGFEGQNVAYADGHVEWSTSVFAGAQQDNVYTYRVAKPGAGVPKESVGVVGPTGGQDDTILLPTWDKTIPFPIRDGDDAATAHAK